MLIGLAAGIAGAFTLTKYMVSQLEGAAGTLATLIPSLKLVNHNIINSLKDLK